MLDRLVESQSHTAENKRRNGFLVSTLFLVTMMLGGAMLYSLFAKPLGMMDGDLELSSIVAPVTPAETEPPAEIPKQERTNTIAKTDDAPTRVVNQRDIDESPTTPPINISTAKNQYASRPAGEFKIGKIDFANTGVYSSERSREGTDSGIPLKPEHPTVDPEETDPPKMTPKVEKPQPPKTPTRVSLGVANGKAVELPKPVYPAPAKAVHAEGAVSVQVFD